jgi:hypothetical protein
MVVTLKSLDSEYAHKVIDHAEGVTLTGMFTRAVWRTSVSLLKRAIKGTHVSV